MVEPGRSAGHSTSPQSSDRTTPTYGYHNTFHTHAQLAIDAPPPTYACAINPRTLDRLNAKARLEKRSLAHPPPPYTCTVEIGGVLGLKQELSTPFQLAGHREWNDAYVVLRGTQLSIFRVKIPSFLSKNRAPGPGRLVKTFTLQHAEVGMASDFKKTPLTPRSPFAHLVPSSARQKLYETDPHLFEPVREHVIRLRLETEQFLLCAPSQEEMLNWIENLCAGIDISPPLDDRSEPRYRSLPRRSRRQRLLDSSRINANLDNLSNLETGRRIIAEQERIIRQLYPHLAAANTRTEQPDHQDSHEHAAPSPAADPETDDLDPEDARFPSSHRPGTSSMRRTASREGDGSSEHAQAESEARHSIGNESSVDPKSTPPHRHTPSQALRYRRRCAPVLLASSPRVSDVVFSEGQRLRINVKEHNLVSYTSHPPRYDVHNFSKPLKRLSPIDENAATSRTTSKLVPSPIHVQRPASPMRGVSNDSLTHSLNSLEHDTFGYDLASTSSAEHPGSERLNSDSDEIRSVPPNSEPPSPIAPTQAKADATRRLATLGKTRSSEEASRDNGLSAVALGVGLLI
ncbi:uncharacterized protein BDR25DRAFT_321847 [Lindgomyces ingoldianus]|uniref:Uncharacterized protein n=1 Tax=Lindgomyces ingoldianus TaxID=673940 RepID=A0ACB6RB09_9PLEO|nr:uncharacterized protein BDR25DRAFT_321847 [Lindgomyces ingoldianus]KAF2476371.1 hypothetical protein BDR25DRAFT_321847 [Lindgomyces ingoldianus]